MNEITSGSQPKFVVVVGASAGGLNSVIEVCAQLNDRIDVAILLVLHLTKVSVGDIIVSRIQTNTSFNCKLAEDGDEIKRHHIYMAIPDKHLLVKNGKIKLGDGPVENRWRPSIDVLFRSAAAAYDSRTIGVILSGLLQDGTSGMLAIKRSGGTCIVQDPNEAEYPDMPLNVLNNMEVDFCVPLEEIGAILEEKSKNGTGKSVEIPDDVKAEAATAERVAVGFENVKPLGKQSDYTCPDCGGSMWEMVNDSIVRYRCYTGHVFSANELLIRQSQQLENTLWASLRMMEERKNLLDKMSKEEETKGWKQSASHKRDRANELLTHINKLKEILLEAKNE